MRSGAPRALPPGALALLTALLLACEAEANGGAREAPDGDPVFGPGRAVELDSLVEQGRLPGAGPGSDLEGDASLDEEGDEYAP